MPVRVVPRRRLDVNDNILEAKLFRQSIGDQVGNNVRPINRQRRPHLHMKIGMCPTRPAS